MSLDVFERHVLGPDTVGYAGRHFHDGVPGAAHVAFVGKRRHVSPEHG